VSMRSQWAKWWAGECERAIINIHNRENMERSKICNGWGNTRANAETTRVFFVHLLRTSGFSEHENGKDDQHTVSLSNQNMAHKLVMYGRSLTVLAIQTQYLIHGYWLHFRVGTMEMSLKCGPYTVPFHEHYFRDY
jgi:hypothetical protein